MDARSQRIYLEALGIPLYRRRGGASAMVEGSGGSAARADFIPEADAEEAPLPGERPDTLESLRDEVADCVSCPLHQTRTQTVFGVGDPEARIMFVGEAPGAEEDRRGEPFVGRAGQLLDAMLAAIGLDRKGGGVFIANVLKCRPPNNRDPKPEEVAQCEGYLRRQIEVIQPRVLVALGRVAAQQLLQTQQPLARLRGAEHRFHETPVLVTYHPAYLLRNPADKAKAWADLKVIRERGSGRQ
ncbi:uracil-DNA glycosylase [Thiohalorhabdus sp. Cl-TMA]|uniref:Type-4 uracil-DNA glycosylase n=1 Tax=Thiohalorhabdus methylotrophus TaxID=3242694 RepID=A0ABV4TYV8_9GAMM